MRPLLRAVSGTELLNVNEKDENSGLGWAGAARSEPSTGQLATGFRGRLRPTKKGLKGLTPGRRLYMLRVCGASLEHHFFFE